MGQSLAIVCTQHMEEVEQQSNITIYQYDYSTNTPAYFKDRRSDYHRNTIHGSNLRSDD